MSRAPSSGSAACVFLITTDVSSNSPKKKVKNAFTYCHSAELLKTVIEKFNEWHAKRSSATSKRSQRPPKFPLPVIRAKFPSRRRHVASGGAHSICPSDGRREWHASTRALAPRSSGPFQNAPSIVFFAVENGTFKMRDWRPQSNRQSRSLTECAIMHDA